MPAALKALRAAGKPSVVLRRDDGPPPECPAWLDDAAREEWERVASGLVELGLLTRVDAAALACYCTAVSHLQTALGQIAEDGPTVEGSQGQKRMHPAYQTADNALKQIHRFALEFGFTPSSRNRIELPVGNPEGDEFEQFIGDNA